MTIAASTTCPDAFEYVRKLVAERSAIELESSKTYLVDARLGPVAQRHGLSCVTELVGVLKRRTNSPLHEEVVEALTTNETSFFRDLAPFEALRQTVLPDLIQRRSVQRTLAIWSAACSSGQELYSIAMLLRENFPTLQSWKVNLLGTDLSGQMVDRAQAGTFNQAEVNRGLPASSLIKYFQRQGMQWKLNDDLRGMATWKRMNLIETWTSVPPM
ncbi:MAG TPA: protein-glutamate O-methyltransferase CheR, partial [Polyangia bacterium]|nr:protein-glutamate O-methyltransferase CheR [Polyangia bacterium]